MKIRQDKLPEFLAKVDFEIPPTRGIQSTYFADENEFDPDGKFVAALKSLHPTAIVRGIKRRVKSQSEEFSC